MTYADIQTILAEKAQYLLDYKSPTFAGQKFYPPNANWVDEIRPSILKRDKYRCQLCYVRHRQNIVKIASGKHIRIDNDEVADFKYNGKQVIKLFLQVHHIDKDKSNNIHTNLISLCPYCHFIAEKDPQIIENITKNIK